MRIGRGMGRYRVTVVETITNWIYVEVEAGSPEEANVRAEDLYDPDAFHDSRIEIDCFDAVPVEVRTAEESAVAGTRWLSIEEIEDLSREDFDALPAADKRRYYRYMDRQNSPPQDEL